MSANLQVHDKVVCLTTFQNTEIARLFSARSRRHLLH